MAMMSSLLDYLVSFKHNLTYVFKVDALYSIGVSGFHFLRPLSKYTCTVDIAIIPRIPYKMFKLSNACHTNGIIVKNTKVPLKLIFFSFWISVFLMGERGENRGGCGCILQRMR